MNPLAAIVISLIGIAGLAVLLAGYTEEERRRYKARLEDRLVQAQRAGDHVQILRIINELRTL